MRHRFVLIAVLVIATSGSAADEPTLATLRDSYAREWFKPEAHLRLAKYLADHGDRLTGFYISETARRGHFPAEMFDPAVRLVFLGDAFDNSPETEKRLQAELGREPEDVKTLVALADVHLSRAEWKKAEVHLRRALSVDPESDAIWPLAEVLRRDGREVEGDKLEADWLAAHPDSQEAWMRRVDDAMRSESPEALKAVNAALERFPDVASLHFNRAHLLHRMDDLEGATAEYVLAAQLDPRSAYIQGWTGRFFLKARKEEEKSLEYYLKAYFLDPHFYDTEFAEGRVRTLAYKRGAARFAAARERGTTAPQLLESDDPVIVGFALQEVGKHWAPAALPKLVALLAHDDDTLRYGAANVIAGNVGAEFDEQLRTLLRSPDLRVRSAAAYIAGARWKEKTVPMFTAWLEEPVDLVRYDAVSVLLEYGGEEGKNVLRSWRASGKGQDPRLTAILESMDEPPSPEE